MKPIFTYSALGNNGRLGNQLFQVASTIGIAEKEGGIVRLPYWPSSDIFPNSKELCNDPAGLGQYEYHEKLFCYTEFEPNTAMMAWPVINLNGYYQSEKYWKHCKKEVLDYFQFKEQTLAFCNRFLYTQSMPLPTAVHFRFGDYINNAYHGDLTTTDYYQRAFAREEIKNRRLLVFSDEPDRAENWMSQFAASMKYYIMRKTSEEQDLCMMSLLRHHIIANSSFSWWGAYLAQSKCVIAPRQWFGNAGLDTKDLYTEEMTII